MKFRKLYPTLTLLFGFTGAIHPLSAQHRPKHQLSSVRPNSCAVSMDSMKVTRNVLYFYYWNTSRQDVEGVLLDAAYFDINHQPHHIQVWGNYNDTVHPGKYKIGALNINFLRSIGYTGLSLWPTKVRFKDGSTWDMDPQSSKCGVEQRGNLQLVGTLPTANIPALLATSQP